MFHFALVEQVRIHDLRFAFGPTVMLLPKLSLFGLPTIESAYGRSMADIETIAGSVASLKEGFEEHRYICSDEIATAVFLAYQLRKPVLIEGPPGVGKTELAKTAAEMFSLPLVRLQCYEGLDESKAIYEWKYGKHLLYTQVLKEALDEVLQPAKGFAQPVTKLH